MIVRIERGADYFFCGEMPFGASAGWRLVDRWFDMHKVI